MKRFAFAMRGRADAAEHDVGIKLPSASIYARPPHLHGGGLLATIFNPIG
jgi:hypothetical protein